MTTRGMWSIRPCATTVSPPSPTYRRARSGSPIPMTGSARSAPRRRANPRSTRWRPPSRTRLPLRPGCALLICPSQPTGSSTSSRPNHELEAMTQTDNVAGRVTIVTQTRVRAEQDDAFARWQAETSKIVAGFPGFVEQSVMPPSPPQQVDWVILQRFASEAQAVAWLNSQERLKRVQGAQLMLVGSDDVHIVKDGGAGALPAPVAVVISTRIKPGQEAAYRRWEQRIAVAQTKALGFQGYRFEPPIPGVQEDWLSILRFDTEEHLQAWMDSPERHALLEDATEFTEEFHSRIARTGF